MTKRLKTMVKIEIHPERNSKERSYTQNDTRKQEEIFHN